MKRATIGIDIGGTNTIIGLADKSGWVPARTPLKTRDYKKVEMFVEEICKEIISIKEKYKSEYEIIGVGIGAPNGNFYKGTIEFAPNLPWKGIIEFAKMIEENIKIPVVLTNDAKAAAIGEMVYGGAKGMKNFLVITLGTGLGSGFVVNGELIYGHDGFAGELGHTIVFVNGRECGCGRKGCLETYVSATGIKRTVFEFMSDYNYKSDLRDLTFNEIDSKIIYDKALEGDEVCLKAFDFTAQILGRQLADAVAICSPEAIFIFGGLAKAGGLIIDATKHYMEESLLPIYRHKIKIVPSSLEESDAAVLGAAALAFKQFETDNIVG